MRPCNKAVEKVAIVKILGRDPTALFLIDLTSKEFFVWYLAKAGWGASSIALGIL